MSCIKIPNSSIDYKFILLSLSLPLMHYLDLLFIVKCHKIHQTQITFPFHLALHALLSPTNENQVQSFLQHQAISILIALYYSRMHFSNRCLLFLHNYQEITSGEKFWNTFITRFDPHNPCTFCCFCCLCPCYHLSLSFGSTITWSLTINHNHSHTSFMSTPQFVK